MILLQFGRTTARYSYVFHWVDVHLFRALIRFTWLFWAGPCWDTDISVNFRRSTIEHSGTVQHMQSWLKID